jgi:amino acid adenylation domain-containing protein
MQLESLLERTAERFPEKTALVCRGQRLSYRDVEQRANRLAHSLRAEGVQRGDRVAVYLDNSVETVVAVFAILKAGAVFLVINPTTKAAKLSYILNNCRARGLVMPANKREAMNEMLSATPHLERLWLAGGAGKPEPAEGNARGKRSIALDAVMADAGLPADPLPKTAIDMDLAALIYTSGSTGHPKGVMLTHLNLLSAVNSVTTYLENTPQDVLLNLLPLSFGYGLNQVLTAFQVGATVVLERSFTYPHAVLQTIIREKVTGLAIVPAISAILLQLDLAAYEFSALRYITNAAAALPADHIRRLRKILPAVKIYSMYGLTECTRVSYLPPDQIDSRPTSVGRGMPNQEVYIADEDGQRVAPGTVGELVVRGSHVMKGYWESPQETARALRPGLLPGERVLFTGDLFRMDEEGYLYFFGRKDDIIKTRGEKVSPKEVEDVLYGLEAISEAAVIGAPDDVLGEAIHAFIQLREGARLTEQDVLRHCAERLESFMVPQAVTFVASLPKTGSGKIQKRQLTAIEMGETA